jgi:hypothetical protein
VAFGVDVGEHCLDWRNDSNSGQLNRWKAPARESQVNSYSEYGSWTANGLNTYALKIVKAAVFRPRPSAIVQATVPAKIGARRKLRNA